MLGLFWLHTHAELLHGHVASNGKQLTTLSTLVINCTSQHQLPPHKFMQVQAWLLLSIQQLFIMYTALHEYQIHHCHYINVSAFSLKGDGRTVCLCKVSNVCLPFSIHSIFELFFFFLFTSTGVHLEAEP